MKFIFTQSLPYKAKVNFETTIKEKKFLKVV